MAEPTDPDCLFCKIVAGDIPATVVRESERTLAFRDIHPQAPTHILVIPKAHYPNAGALAAAEPALAGALLSEAAEVAADEKLDGSGYRLIFNTGAGAGQTVFHAHVHLLGGRGFSEGLV
ncbi:histidine triad (HIT) family protein [Kitasatospora sp. MAP12-15]|uniref:histidine triad nucleotide-binding protein n=1 Tax=unclassified Kitasatospora TaxID=2633591 RepID=UPI00247527A6|nr:histidine triad nucleotide-binding protein [Kitasatospora sp. MAP12-44]MDH6110460.1 histidine triad (HIT) family protein [Kitasatospora sp. MAP12-44]